MQKGKILVSILVIGSCLLLLYLIETVHCRIGDRGKSGQKSTVDFYICNLIEEFFFC